MGLPLSPRAVSSMAGVDVIDELEPETEEELNEGYDNDEE